MGFSFVHPKKTASDLDLLFLFSLSLSTPLNLQWLLNLSFTTTFFKKKEPIINTEHKNLPFFILRKCKTFEKNKGL